MKNLEQFPAEVKKVLSVKYAAKPFAQLTELEKEAHALALLLKINVVTGWPVPESEEQENILAEQLKLYLVESWPTYNVDEIMYAMRSYATVLNNWGKNMNLTLIGKAMADYEKERADVSALEESKANKPLETNLLTLPADWKELCEINYQDYLKGYLNLSLMPYQLYDEFVKCKMMEAEAYEDFVNEAYAMLVSEIKSEIIDAVIEREKEGLKLKLKAIVEGENELKVEQQAKRLAVQYLYKTAKETGFKNLFVKED